MVDELDCTVSERVKLVREQNAMVKEREEQLSALKNLKDRVRRMKTKAQLVEQNKQLKKELSELKQLKKVKGFKDRDRLVTMLEQEREGRKHFEQLSEEFREQLEEREGGPTWLRHMKGPKILRLGSHNNQLTS